MIVVLQLVVPVLVSSYVLSRAYNAIDGPFVDEWGTAHGLTLSDRNRPMVHWYLRTARILRAWGVLAGLFLPSLLDAAIGTRALQQNQPFFAFVGYLVGALYAELSLVRPAAGDRRVATLVPREVNDYLPRRLVLAQRALAVATIVGVTLVLALPFDQHADFRPSAATVLPIVVSAAVLGFSLERIERWLVQRPQPFSDSELVAADDAIRSQSVHSVAGSGLAMLLLLLGATLFGLATSDVQVLRWTMWVPALVCFLGSIQVCLYYGHRAWRVRRSLPRGAPA